MGFGLPAARGRDSGGLGAGGLASRPPRLGVRCRSSPGVLAARSREAGGVGCPADPSGESPSDVSGRPRPLLPPVEDAAPSPLVSHRWRTLSLSLCFSEVGDAAPSALLSASPARRDLLPRSLRSPEGIARLLRPPYLLSARVVPFPEKDVAGWIFPSLGAVTSFEKKSLLSSHRLCLSLSWESYFWVPC